MSRSHASPTDERTLSGGAKRRGDRSPGAEKPLLLLDIDGVVSLFGFDPAAHPAGSFHSIDGILHFLSATAGEHLLALSSSFEAVWCSGWEEKANEYLPDLLGLPAPLPFLTFGRRPGAGQAHWKLAAIDAYAGQRPLAWIDDALDDACRTWAGARAAPTLLVAAAPERGITNVEVQRLLEWAQAIERADERGDGLPGARSRG